MTSEYGYKEFDEPPVRSVKRHPKESLGPVTSNSINRGLAAMPAQERSIPIDERAVGGDQPQRRHREAMARNTSPKGSNPRAEAHTSEWDDAAGWDQESDEATRHRTKRLLSRSNSRFHRFGDKFAVLQLWITGERWVKRVAIVIAVLAVIFTGCFGGLWWRLGAGPINLDVATPWLAAAIEDKMKQKELAEALEYRTDQAKLESKRQQIEADGLKAYNDTLNSSLTPNVLKWEAIQATKKLSESPNTKVIIMGNTSGTFPLMLSGDK